MKRFLIIFAVLSLVFTSCSKYKEGPKLSLRTRTARLAGNWSIDKVTYNGSDITSTYNALVSTSEKMAILKSKRWGYAGDAGKWELGEDGDDVTFTSDQAGSQPVTYRILKLYNTEMWWKETKTNGDIYEYHWKQ